MKITVVLLLYFHTCFGYKNYKNYTLFRILPLTEDQLEFVKNLSSIIKVDYWRPPGTVKKPVDVLINPEDKKLIMRTLDEKQFYYTTVMDDVQKAFDMQTIKSYIRRKMDSFDWRSFFSVKDIYSWINDLEKSNPTVVKILHLGRTYEDREILGVRVVPQGSKRRSAVVIEGGIHAREWISTAFVTYFLNELVKSENSSDSDLGKIARTYEFYFIPIVNPDGLEYSMNEDRMWRKNRFAGYGIDLNRNFDVGFGKTGVSFKKTDQTYCGSYAFSEKESQAVRRLTTGIKDKLEYYLAFHSYGQFIIIPYAHIKEHTENYEEVHDILNQARSEIAKRYSTKYRVGTAFETVGYTTSGVSGCWVKKAFKVPYVATFELRDTGTYGFALPPNQILPTCRETLDGVIAILLPKSSTFRKLSSVYRNSNNYNNKKTKHVLDELVILFDILFFMMVKLN